MKAHMVSNPADIPVAERKARKMEDSKIIKSKKSVESCKHLVAAWPASKGIDDLFFLPGHVGGHREMMVVNGAFDQVHE